LKKGGLAIVNTAEIYPVEVIMGLEKYPLKENLLKPIEVVADKTIAFNATSLARKSGSVLSMNIVMTGALAATGALPFSEDLLIDALKNFIQILRSQS